MKSELLVTAGQHTAVNMFPGLVHTARHVMGVGNTRSRWANRKEAAVEGGTGDWDEVVKPFLRPLAGNSERQKLSARQARCLVMTLLRGEKGSNRM